jgi:SAM-dependent methyltransferase
MPQRSHVPPPPLSLAESSPLVRTLLAEQGIDPAGGSGPDLTIGSGDEMLDFVVASHDGDREQAVFDYFQTGTSIARSLIELLRWRFGDRRRPDRVLDFASGYGRSTRFLLRELPAERVWVSDVYAGAVRFQQERFGVHGIVSTVRPEEFRCGETFDAIFVVSLFTHLPEERFVAWLRVLRGLLAPGGMLVFSVHDQSLRPPGTELPPAGLLFQEYSESGSLSTSDYGSTWVSEKFVHEAWRRAAGAESSLRRLPYGLCNYQDLYVAVPEAGVDFSTLAYRGDPYLFVEHCYFAAPDLLEVSGWAASLRPTGLREVQVVLDGEVLASLPINQPRTDVAAQLGEGVSSAGWGGPCALPRGASRSTSLFCLRVIDDRGAAHLASAGSLETALLAAARREAKYLRDELERAEVRAAHAALDAEALAARIAAMQASRFWKLRNRWFRLKRLLGMDVEV